MLWKSLLLVIYPLLLILPRDVTAAATNRTIDDEYGDSVTGLKPIFLPTTTGAWEGETCAGCRVQPDKALAFRQTFNAATARPDIGPISIGLSFKGTAIYVFFIIANFVPGDITTLTECNFTLDGQHAGYYRHEPSTDTNFQYNVPVFSTTGLANVDHNLNVSANGADYHVFVNFDYAIYTFDDTPSTPIVPNPGPSTITTPQPASSPNQPNQQNPPTNPSTNPSTNPFTNPSTMQPTSNSGQSINQPIQSTGTQPPGSQQPTNQHSSTPTTKTGTDSNATSQLNGSNKPPVGAIVGGVVGGLVVLGLLLLLLFCWRRKRPIKIKNDPPSVSGYNSNYLTVNAGPLNDSRSLDPTSTLSSSQYIPGYIRGDVPNNVESTNSFIIASDTLTTPPSSVNEARSARRVHLERKLRAVERELASLRTGQSISSRQPSIHKAADTNSEMAELRRQIVQMREQIEYLQLQNPADPPPDYSEERSA